MNIGRCLARMLADRYETEATQDQSVIDVH